MHNFKGESSAVPILMRTKLVENRYVIYLSKLASWIIREYNLFRQIFRFYNSKKAVMNFAKYIVAHFLSSLVLVKIS